MMVRKLAVAVGICGLLGLPVGALAGPGHGHGPGHAKQAVPELTLGAAGAALVVAVGGLAIFASRRRRRG